MHCPFDRGVQVEIEVGYVFGYFSVRTGYSGRSIYHSCDFAGRTSPLGSVDQKSRMPVLVPVVPHSSVPQTASECPATTGTGTATAVWPRRPGGSTAAVCQCHWQTQGCQWHDSDHWHARRHEVSTTSASGTGSERATGAASAASASGPVPLSEAILVCCSFLDVESQVRRAHKWCAHRSHGQCRNNVLVYLRLSRPSRGCLSICLS